jgi:hypothetical protein
MLTVLTIGTIALGQEPVPPGPVVNTDPPSEGELPIASIEVVDSDGQAVEEAVPVGQLLIVTSEQARHAGVKGSLTWIVKPRMQTFSSNEGKTLIINTGLKPTTITIMQIVSSVGGANTYQEMSIRVGEAPQPPPVNPDDVPTPVDPAPVIPATPSLRFLIIEEKSLRGLLKPAQLAVFESAAITAYAEQKCSKTLPGVPDKRVYDKDLVVTKEPAWIQNMWKEARPASYPWIVITNGVTGASQPLPATVDETLALLKKYGG